MLFSLVRKTSNLGRVDEVMDVVTFLVFSRGWPAANILETDMEGIWWFRLL